MNTKESQYNWSELAYKIDPRRIFYKPKKRNKYGTRKG